MVLAFEHVGSTSIRAMAATIDNLAGVGKLNEVTDGVIESLIRQAGSNGRTSTR
jgi:GrpB-like predicted nucleotidyltransferase (UPF0157 family)